VAATAAVAAPAGTVVELPQALHPFLLLLETVMASRQSTAKGYSASTVESSVV